MLGRSISRVSCRGIKTNYGARVERVSSNTLINQRNDIGRAGFSRSKDDYMVTQKKSATLAYPEDALITEYGAAKVKITPSNFLHLTSTLSGFEILNSAISMIQNWLLKNK